MALQMNVGFKVGLYQIYVKIVSNIVIDYCNKLLVNVMLCSIP